MVKSLRSVFAFVFALALFSVVSSAEALTVSPVRLEMRGDPGTSATGTFQLLNEQDTEMTFYVSFENFEAQGEDGTPRFVEGETGLSMWVHLLPEGLTSTTLAPHATQEVIYEIDIPSDAEPGGYFAAIFWGTTPPAEEDAQTLSVGAKVGILLFLTVNGTVEEGGGLLEFALEEGQPRFFSELPVRFFYRIRNEGTDRMIPTGSLTIRNLFGIVTESIPLNPSQNNILPSSVRRFETLWGEPVENPPEYFMDHVRAQASDFALGHYRADLEVLLDSTDGKEIATITFWVLPWHLLSLVAGGLIFVLLFVTLVLRTYNRWIIAQVVAQLQKHRPPKITPSPSVSRAKPSKKSRHGSSK